MYRLVPARTAVLALALALLVGACSSEVPTYPVDGQVVYSDTGEPVPGGDMVIWFESTTPPYQRASGLVRGGKFNLTTSKEGSGAMEGEHRVRFDPYPPGSPATEPPEVAIARVMHPKHLHFHTSDIKYGIHRNQPNAPVIKVDPPPGGRKKKVDPPKRGDL